MTGEHVLELLEYGIVLRWRRMDGWVLYWWQDFDAKRPRESTIRALMAKDRVIHVGSSTCGSVRLVEDGDPI